MKSLTRPQKIILAWSVLFLLSAEAVKYLGLAARATKVVGLAELLIAIVTGIAVGLSMPATPPARTNGKPILETRQ